jgi:hypothetical protein
MSARSGIMKSKKADSIKASALIPAKPMKEYFAGSK